MRAGCRCRFRLFHPFHLFRPAGAGERAYEIRDGRKRIAACRAAGGEERACCRYRVAGLGQHVAEARTHGIAGRTPDLLAGAVEPVTERREQAIKRGAQTCCVAYCLGRLAECGRDRRDDRAHRLRDLLNRAARHGVPNCVPTPLTALPTCEKAPPSGVVSGLSGAAGPVPRLLTSWPVLLTAWPTS